MYTHLSTLKLNDTIKPTSSPTRSSQDSSVSSVTGALFLAAFVASCILGALPPVDILAVCFVLVPPLCCTKHGLAFNDLSFY